MPKQNTKPKESAGKAKRIVLPPMKDFVQVESDEPFVDSSVYVKNLTDILAKFSPRYNKREVFKDFVTTFAISIANSGFDKSQEREDEYLSIMKRYKDDFPVLLAKAAGELVMALDNEPTDILGRLFMSMGLGDAERGQFFTPSPLAELNTKMLMANYLSDHSEYHTVCDPACGAGAMLLAAVKEIISQGFNPPYRIYCEGVDIDRLSALMCYIQLSLWNVPARVIVGNSLSLEIQEVWETPAFISYGWKYKLAKKSKRKSK